MCGESICCICGMKKEMCGQPCHGFCQWYHWKASHIHQRDSRKFELDETIFYTASGTW